MPDLHWLDLAGYGDNAVSSVFIKYCLIFHHPQHFILFFLDVVLPQNRGANLALTLGSSVENFSPALHHPKTVKVEEPTRREARGC